MGEIQSDSPHTQGTGEGFLIQYQFRLVRNLRRCHLSCIWMYFGLRVWFLGRPWLSLTNMQITYEEMIFASTATERT